MSGQKTPMFLKITAVTVAAVFLWNQIVWAGDLQSVPASGQDNIETIPQIGDPEIVDSRQDQMESLISTKQDIEDFVYQSSDDNIETKKYYASGRICEITFTDGLIKKYSDEDWNGTGIGKLIKETSPDGSYKTYEDYYTETNQAGSITEYDAGGIYQKTNEYRENGILEKETHASGAITEYYESGNRRLDVAANGLIFEYLDENWDNSGRGRWTKLVFQDGHWWGYEDHYAGINQARYRKEYDKDNNLTETKEYAENGRIIFRYYVSGRVNKEILFSDHVRVYLDEDWKGTGRGRLIRIYEPDCSSKGYEDFYEGTSQARYVKEYDKYRYLIKTTEYAIDGTFITDSPVEEKRYEYYDSGKVKKETYPDGRICEYSDENWHGIGKGRLLKETAPDGSYIVYEEYYAATTFQEKCVKEYSKDNALQLTKEYYFNGGLKRETYADGRIYEYYESGLIRTETLEDSTIYEYSDEDWNGTAKGKLTKETAPDGSYKTYEDYYGGTNQARYITEYDKNGVFQLTNEYDADGLLVIDELIDENECEYYESGLIRTETLEDGTIYEYSDEDWNGTGRGRLTKETAPDGSYKTYEDYYGGTNQARYITEYDKNGVFQLTNEYDADGLLVIDELIDENECEYYESGLIRTETLEDGTIYEYSDEDWNGTGRGRLIKETAPDGSYKTYEDYYEGTNQAKYIKEYSKDDELLLTCEYNSVGTLLKKTYDDGRICTYYESMRIKTEVKSDGTTCEYSDKDWNGTGKGRLIKETAPDESYKTYESYYAGTNQARYIKEYDAGGIYQKTNEYRVNGSLKKETYANGAIIGYYESGNVWLEVTTSGMRFEYLDENWNGSGKGRWTKLVFQDGHWWGYEDYYAGINQARYKKEYDKDSNLTETKEYAENGRIIFRYYVSGRVNKEILFDDHINVYMDEDWNGTGRGRLIRAYEPDCSCTGYEDFYEGTSQARYVREYDKYKKLIKTTEYAIDGTFITDSPVEEKKYEYYDSGKVKKETYPDGKICEYSDEDWNGRGKGKLLKETAPDGSYIVYEEYYAATMFQEKCVKEYSKDNVLQLTKEYYFNGGLKRETYADGIIYEYSDEDWNGTGRGRLIKEIAPDGSYKTCENYYGGTNQARYIKKYNSIGEEMLLYEYASNGNLLRKILPNGTYIEFYYDNGAITNSYQYAPDGTISVFDADNTLIYEYNPQDTPDTSAEDRSSVISVTSSAGDVISYIDGKIVSILLKEDRSLLDNLEFNDDGNLKEARIKYSDGTVGIVYNGKIIQKTLTNGCIIRFKNNRISSEYSSTISLTIFTYITDTDGNIESIVTLNSHAKCEYDANGQPIKFTKQTGEIIEYENGRLRKIVDSSGAEYLYAYIGGEAPRTELIGETDNNEVPVVIYYDEAGAVKEVRNAAGNIITYNGAFLESVTAGDEETTYNYVLNGSNLVEKVEVDRGGIKRIYDEFGNLESISVDDDSKIIYESGEVLHIEKSDGTKIKDMTFTETGELSSALIAHPDGSISVYSDGELLKTITGRGDTTTYSEGKIETVTLSDGTILDWTYEGDLIKIHDSVKKENRWYLEGELQKIEELAGTELTTAYYYSDENKVEKTEVSQSGDILFTYTYAYEEDLTIIKDESGNIQAYNKDKKITYIIDSKGRKYEYTYIGEDNADTRDITLANGSRVKYDSEGSIIEILKSDGTLIKDITFTDENQLKDCTYVKDNNTYTVENGTIRKIITADGAVYIYDEAGFVRSVETSSGDKKECEYYINDEKNIGLTQITDSYTLTNVESAGETILKLEGLFDYGNGSDGEIYAEGYGPINYVHYDTQCTNLYIPPGGFIQTLTWDRVSDATLVIKSQGPIVLKGPIYAEGAVHLIAPKIIIDDAAIRANRAPVVTELTDEESPQAMISLNAEYIELKSAHFIIENSNWMPLAVEFDYSTVDGKFPEVPTIYMPVLSVNKIQSITRGEVNSEVIETNALTYGTISWAEKLENTSDITFQVRTGNTPEIDSSWSDWSLPVTNPAASDITSPAAEYIQYKAILTKEDGEKSPELLFDENSGIRLSYTRTAQSAADLDNLERVEITQENGEILRYASWDDASNATLGTSDVPFFIFEDKYFEKLKLTLPEHILNKTQKTICQASNVTISELKEIKNIEGTVIQYIQGRISEIDFSDGTKVKEIVFDNDTAQEFIYVADGIEYNVENGVITEYYESGNVRVEVAANGLIFEYLDENWNGSGKGRCTKLVFQDGHWWGYEDHYAGINQARYKKEYDKDNNLTETKEYAENGRIIFRYYVSGRVNKEILFDDHINVYMDEDWNGTGRGRLIRAYEPDCSGKGYEDFYEGTSQARYVREYDKYKHLIKTTEYAIDGTFITDSPVEEKKYEYYDSGKVKKETYPDGRICEYSDEDWNGRGKGKLLKETASDGSYIVYEEYYAATMFQEKCVKEYSSDGTLQITKEYYFNGGLKKETYANGAITEYYESGEQLTQGMAGFTEHAGSISTDLIGKLSQDLASYRLNSAQKIIAVYNEEGDKPVQTITADHSITYYNDGYADRIEDASGTVLLQYTYDENKNLLQTEFVDARKKLETGYEEALKDLKTQKADALIELAQAEQDAVKDIEKQVADIQKQIDSERRRLQMEKAKYDPERYDLSEFDKVFRELDEYEVTLAAERAKAYKDLEEKISQAKKDIEIDAETAMKNLLEDEYMQALGDIAQKESAPLIYHYYRSVLGRDPGKAELEYWLNKAKEEKKPVTPEDLTGHIESLEEYTQRKAWKQSIITEVKTFFTQYLESTAEQKETMLNALGITKEETENVELNEEIINTILTWLDSQSLHFGDSAFKTIMKLLKRENITKTFSQIGSECIKADILTGVITQETKGDLVISMNAMARIAETEGLVLYGERIDFEELKSQIAINNSIILHINSDHYVLLKAIDEEKGTVTYKDLSVGESGEVITLSRAEFMEEWAGYVLSKNEIVNIENENCRYLNTAQMKNIRGSGWWSDFWKGICSFFQKVVAPVAAVLLFIPAVQLVGAVALGLNVMIQTVSCIVRTGTLMDVVWSVGTCMASAAIGATANMITDISKAAGTSFMNTIIPGLKGAFESAATMPIFQGIGNMVSSIASGIGHVFMPIVGEAAAASLATTVIGTAVGMGTSFVLDSIKLDPTMTSIASALMSGLFMGAASPDMSPLASMLRSGTIETGRVLGEAAGLDENTTELLALTAGSLVGAPEEDWGKIIAGNIAMEMAYTGVLEVGESLGIDPRISRIAGLAIRSSLGAGLSGIGGGGSPGETIADIMVKGAIEGLKRGVTSLAIDYVTEKLDLDPITANAIVLAVGGAIDGAQDGDILKGIADAYKNAILNAVSFGVVKVNEETGQIQIALGSSWQEAAYISRVLEITDNLKEKGLEQTLYDYSASVLHYEAVNGFARPGGVYDILGEHLSELGNVAFEVIDKLNGTKEIKNTETGETIGRYKEEKGKQILETGKYGKNPETGKEEVKDGRRFITVGNIIQTIEFREWGIEKITRLGIDNGLFIQINGLDDANIIYDETTGEATTYEIFVTIGDSNIVQKRTSRDGKIETKNPLTTGKVTSPKEPYDRYSKWKFMYENLSDGWDDEYPEPPNDGGGQDRPNWEAVIAQKLFDWGFLEESDNYYNRSVGIKTEDLTKPEKEMPYLIEQWGLLDINEILSTF